ncbi:protein ACCELERATED CELL DEATH 6-like [Silene latifolia]|uniref:protein ACCELERATED CELL DEATH 6-like n=1 Tax=Silene latifolia TaxID=37657 RepID=UPI003D773EB0
MYASLSWDDDDHVKPWLTVSWKHETPLNLSLDIDEPKEKCAMEILLMDPELKSWTIADKYGNTPLFYAIKRGFNLVAENILMSHFPSTSLVGSTSLLSLLSLATNTNCSEKVVKLLFKTFGQWMDKIDSKGYSVLHEWAETGEAGPCKLLLEKGDVGDARTKIFRECIFEKEKRACDTPLHLAARKKDSELGQILVRGYQEQVSARRDGNEELAAIEYPPWKVTNILGNTPLHSALYAKHEKLALQILSIDSTSCKIRNNKGESPFFLAVKSGCSGVVDAIMGIAIMGIEVPRFDMLGRNDGTTVLHCLSSCPEETCKTLLNKYWWIIKLRDDQGNTALDYAQQANTPWLVNLLTNPSLIQQDNFDLIEACKREETEAILAFVDSCQNQERVCREINDTPLHHIKLPTYKDYLNFLKIPSIKKLKNTIDSDGATPLHRALEREDIILAKILLQDDKVKRTIADKNGKTAMHLLAKLCKENDDWEKMCTLVQVNPYVKRSYIQLGNNLDQIRNTLSIVAALLATITFAAGFTLPGGIDSNTGQALLVKQMPFIVFLLADAYAMCSSMLTLFLLTWSMTLRTDDAWLLVQRSLQILSQSLFATMMAFSIGIHLVIPHGSSIWVSIVIHLMSGSILLWVITAAFLNISTKVIFKLTSAPRRGRQHYA